MAPADRHLRCDFRATLKGLSFFFPPQNKILRPPRPSAQMLTGPKFPHKLPGEDGRRTVRTQNRRVSSLRSDGCLRGSGDIFSLLSRSPEPGRPLLRHCCPLLRGGLGELSDERRRSHSSGRCWAARFLIPVPTSSPLPWRPACLSGEEEEGSAAVMKRKNRAQIRCVDRPRWALSEVFSVSLLLLLLCRMTSAPPASSCASFNPLLLTSRFPK